VDKARKKPDASAHRGVSHARRHVVPVGLGAQFAPSTRDRLPAAYRLAILIGLSAALWAIIIGTVLFLL
jgi:hypothetical protein